MSSKFPDQGKLWMIFLFSTLLATSAFAGTNEGFTASITSPTTIKNPAVGQTISILVEVQNASQAKGGLITAKYDADLFSFEGFSPGTFILGMLSLPGTPTVDADGLTIIQGGGTQLGGTPASGSGPLGTMTFKLTGELPSEGASISIIDVQVQASASDKDNLSYEVGELSVKARPDFPNKIFDLRVIDRRHNAAKISWFTRFAGLNDKVQYRAVGAEEWQTAQNPLLDRATPAVLADLKMLREAGVDLKNATPALIQATLDKELTPLAIELLRVLNEALDKRLHLVPLIGLELNTNIEFTVRSTDLGGRLSPSIQGIFQTRLAPDVRPVRITNLDIQTGATSAIVRWFTNRPADTRVKVEKTDATGVVVETIAEIEADEDGTQVHIASIENLESGVALKTTVNSRLIDADDQIADGSMTEDLVADEKIQLFRTRREVPLRFSGPPQRIPGAEEVRIQLRLNLPAWVTIDYGEIANVSGKITAETEVATSQLYTESITSSEVLDQQEITLSGLEPGTQYRFRITAYTPDAPAETEGQPLNTPDRITTDPRGNRQWSRDLRFKTSLVDNTPPAFDRWPQVHAGGRVAVVRWSNDVPTIGKLFLGTWTDEQITLGTADEWEIVDLAPNGKPRLARNHIITVPALGLKTKYGYRIEATAINGQSVAFDPLTGTSASAKIAKILQPPGGAGSFTTKNEPDTQFPVILSGPTTTSRTHDTVVIEWTTDEPANSEVSFGTEGLDDEESSGDNEISHKMVLSGLESGETYSYIVGATDAVGNGATESATAVFTTSPEIDLIAPQITAEPEIIYKNDKSATIQWSTDEDATGEVEFGASGDLGLIRTLSTTSKVHEITLTSLEPNTEYFFKAASTDLSSNGPTESEILSFTTDTEPDLDSPVISSIVATPADSSVIITWATDELANSYVEFGSDAALLEFNVGDVENLLKHEIVLTNLTPGIEYFYQVGSVDRANNPPAESEALSFTTLTEADATPPAVPAGLVAAAGSGQAVLSWTAGADADLAGYNVYRRVAGEEEFETLSTRVTETSYTDQGLVNSTDYEYQVTAIDRAKVPNESAPSELAQVTPTASAAPSIPGDLAREGDDYLRPTFVFTNSTPVNAGATLTYTIQVSTESDFSNVTTSISGLAEGSGDAGTGRTGWTIDRDLEEGATYYWQVRAIEGSLPGDFSAAQQFAAVDPSALPGDFNADLAVTFDDFFIFVDVFGQDATGELAVYDLDGGGSVDFNDFFIFVDNFGKTAAGKRWAVTQEIDSRAIFSLEALGGTRADDRRVSVRVWADQVENLQAFGLVLHYDPQAVEWEEASGGPGHLLASRGGQAPLFAVMSQTPGELVLGNGITSGEPVSGRGLLAELTFHVVGLANNAYFDLAEGFVANSGTQVKRVQQLNSTLLRPQTYHLGANFPNPFNPSTSIDYALPQAGPVELSIYDVLGRRIRILAQDSRHAAGFYTATWDGLDRMGRPTASGVYFYRLKTPQFSRTQKMTLLK